MEEGERANMTCVKNEENGKNYFLMKV